MRLALVHKRFDRLGGAEWDCFEMTHRLIARGHEVHLVVGECRVPPPTGVTVHVVPVVRLSQTAKLLSFALRAPRVWRAFTPDAVIGFGRVPGVDVFRASGGCHRRYLQRLVGERGPLEPVRQRLSVYDRAMLAVERRQYAPAGYRKILAVSVLSRTEILETYPSVPPDDVAVLHYGVDVATFRPDRRAEDGAAVRRELDLPPEQPIVLFVGSGFRRKGVDMLLDIWREGPPGGAALVIVGNDQHVSARRRAARDLPGPVRFTGPRRDVERFHAAADLFTLPSIHEGCPVVILEALASGVPVVTSRATGAPELLTGPLGDLVVDDPRDAPAIRACLERGLTDQHRTVRARAAREAACRASLAETVVRLEDWCRAITENR